MKTKLLQTGLWGTVIAVFLVTVVWVLPEESVADGGRKPSPVSNQPASIDITAPVGGEDLIAGSVYPIQWSQHRCAGTVTLQLWDGIQNRWSTIASEIPVATGQYQWHVNTDLSGHRFRIRITLDQSRDTYWLSNDYFSVAIQKSETRQLATIEDEKVVSVPATGESTLQCFPSIAYDRVHCKWTGTDTPTDISVWSLSGELVAKFIVDGNTDSFEFSTKTWASGMYTVSATFANQQRATSKVIVRR